jgi:phosphonopyruvate decarboxylase
VLLDGIGVPYAVLSDSIDTARTQIRDAVTEAIQGSGARALLVRRATFEAEAPLPVMNADRELCREDVVRAVTARIEPDALLVATTGKTARELFAVRAERGDSHHQDLLVVGSMGHANQVALGVALAQPERPVWILDGDGALLMHLGGLALIGSSGANIRHVAIVNGSHESVGGQPTPVGAVDFAAVAMGLGYAWATHAETADELDSAVDVLRRRTEPGFVEVRTRSGSRPGLARPDRTPADNKRAVMEHLLS